MAFMDRPSLARRGFRNGLWLVLGAGFASGCLVSFDGYQALDGAGDAAGVVTGGEGSGGKTNGTAGKGSGGKASAGSSNGGAGASEPLGGAGDEPAAGSASGGSAGSAAG